MTVDEKTDTATVVEHELALKVYIDSLLLEPVLDTQVEENIGSPSPETQIESESIVETQRAKMDATSSSDEPLECLLFKVAGFLTLAVPLGQLSGILKWSGEAAFIPGHADWFLGLVTNRGHQVKVIDIAKFVIPSNHKSRQALDSDRDFKHILLIDKGKFGLACDELGEVVKISREHVRWREDRGNRTWLAGTLIEQMSALLDMEKFTQMLKEGISEDEIS